jgi:GTP-binding protein
VTAFIDQARILVRGGDGGDGAVAFRREKYVPKGGPSGGDGGDGGSVILQVDEGLSTLLDFRYRHEHKAPSGERGGNKDMCGRRGEDIILRVPAGTLVYDAASGDLLADLQKHRQRFVAAHGGRGGRGNIHFVTATDRAPRHFEPGGAGQRDLSCSPTCRGLSKGHTQGPGSAINSSVISGEPVSSSICSRSALCLGAHRCATIWLSVAS